MLGGIVLLMSPDFKDTCVDLRMRSSRSLSLRCLSVRNGLGGEMEVVIDPGAFEDLFTDW